MAPTPSRGEFQDQLRRQVANGIPLQDRFGRHTDNVIPLLTTHHFSKSAKTLGSGRIRAGNDVRSGPTCHASVPKCREELIK